MKYDVILCERVRRETHMTVEADSEMGAVKTVKELWENGDEGEDVYDCTEDSDPEFVCAYCKNNLSARIDGN